MSVTDSASFRQFPIYHQNVINILAASNMSNEIVAKNWMTKEGWKLNYKKAGKNFGMKNLTGWVLSVHSMSKRWRGATWNFF